MSIYKLFVPILHRETSIDIGENISMGVFKTEKEAVHSLIDLIVNDGYVTYDMHLSTYPYSFSSSELLFINKHKNLPLKIQNDEEFKNIFKIAETEEELAVLCFKYSIITTWTFDIFVHNVNL